MPSSCPRGRPMAKSLIFDRHLTSPQLAPRHDPQRSPDPTRADTPPTMRGVARGFQLSRGRKKRVLREQEPYSGAGIMAARKALSYAPLLEPEPTAR